MKTYIVTPTTGEKPYEVQAESYDFDQTTGHHLFYDNEKADGSGIVANLLNVSVRVKPAAEPTE